MSGVRRKGPAEESTPAAPLAPALSRQPAATVKPKRAVTRVPDTLVKATKVKTSSLTPQLAAAAGSGVIESSQHIPPQAQIGASPAKLAAAAERMRQIAEHCEDRKAAGILLAAYFFGHAPKRVSALEAISLTRWSGCWRRAPISLLLARTALGCNDKYWSAACAVASSRMPRNQMGFCKSDGVWIA